MMTRANGVLAILFIISQGHVVTSSVLSVSITVTYTPPSTFDRTAPYYRAGSPLSLTCEAVGVQGAFYGWTSNCTGSCFTIAQSSGTVSTSYLESVDSGVHTCTVYGINGETGSDSVTVKVVGAGIYVSGSPSAALPNNGMIVAGSSGRIGDFRCVSGSRQSNVGHLFDMNDVDITTSSSDPFFTFRHSPGMVHVRSLRSLHSNEQGIYTCRIPDETGTTVNVNVGLYLAGNALPLTISKMEYSAVGDGTYTITCTTTGSPPTTASWTRNGIELTTSEEKGKYTSSQIVIDRTSSTFDNVLTIKGSYADAVGDYKCNLSNTLGVATANKTINALEVTGYENPIIVGLSGTLRCSTILNVTTIAWYKTGIDTALESSTSSTVDLVLTPNTAALDGTSYTCQAMTASGEKHTETVTIQVKELTNRVSIHGSQSSPWQAGNSFTLTCTATADLPPQVRWTDPSGNSVVEGEGLTLHGPFVSGDTTTLRLTFGYLRTSQAGRYSCLSIIDTPTSLQSAVKDVKVKIPPPTVEIVSHPNTTQVFTTQQLNLTCYTRLDPAVDTAVGVANTWSGPSGVMSSDGHVSVVAVAGTSLEFNSGLYFSSLRSSDSGTYSCFSTVSLVSSYIVSSDSVSATIVITASLKTTIHIDYTPPDQYPDYAPPNYRAASSVTLRCTTEGASGSVSYRWSSTCSSCFASSSSSSSVSENILRSRDRGVHTCTATDNIGNTGSDSIQMNIVGAGIYVTYSQYYAGRQAAQPNNSYITVYSGTYSSANYRSQRFEIFCCSNYSSYSYIGSITDPYGSTYTSNFRELRIERYTRYSVYRGCIRLEGYERYQSSLSYYSGVYTCNIPDANGHNHEVNFAIYGTNTQYQPSLYSFQHESSDSVLKLTCDTRTVPPTEVTWQRNGVNLTVDGNSTKMTQTVTNRPSAYFITTLSINDDPDNVVGNYSVIMGNARGHSQSSNITINGIALTSNRNIGTVGSTITFRCSSDLHPIRIEWYRNGSLLSQTTAQSGSVTLESDLISTDDEGAVYICKAIGHRGSQERDKTLHVQVPQNWASTVISTLPTRDALHNNSYTLNCAVRAIRGMNIAPEVTWYHPNGSQVVTGGRLTVGSTETTGTTTTLTLTFSPVLHEDGGEYSCRAEVTVPWMTTQPPVKRGSVNMVVTTQAMFQLRMGPLTHCSAWEVSKALDLERYIKSNIEQAIQGRCDCDFESSAIYSGEFSCQTTTTEVVYRAMLNGSSELITAAELISYIDEWKTNEGTLLYNKFRLRLAQACPLCVESFNEVECEGDGGGNGRHIDKESSGDGSGLSGGLMLGSKTCYRFQTCGDEADYVNDNDKHAEQFYS